MKKPNLRILPWEIVKKHWEILPSLSRRDQFTIERSRAFYDLPWFAYQITERWTTDKATGGRFAIPDFHKELWQVVGEQKDTISILPRGFGKTTAIAKILVLWLLLFQKEQSILLVMQKGLGEEVVGDIRKELETNAFLRKLFGALVPIRNPEERRGEKWRQRYLQLLNGTELKTITKNEPVRGMRPTKVIIDDPEENKDVKNPVIAEEFYNWVFTSVYPSLNPGGSVAVLGTIISSNCFINKLKQSAKEKKFRVLEFPAIHSFNDKDFTGIPLWPERFPLETLRKLYNKMDKRRFMQEFMNEPFVLNGSPVFDEECIDNLIVVEKLKEVHGIGFYAKKPVDGIYEEKNLELFLGIDLALGGIDGDYTVITGRDKEYNLILQYRGHITQDRVAVLVDEIVKLFPRSFIIPEANNALAFLMKCKEYDWRNLIYKRKEFDKITMKEKREWGWNTNSRTKPLMINELQQVLRAGKFQVSKEEYDEFTHYYYDTEGSMNALSPYHDDMVISASLCVQGIKRGRSQPGIAF